MDTVKYNFAFSDASNTDIGSFRHANFLKKFPIPTSKLKRSRYVEFSHEFATTSKHPSDETSKKSSAKCELLEDTAESINTFLHTEWRNILDRAILTLLDTTTTRYSGRPMTKLKLAQEYILSAIYSDRSLFLCGPPRSGKTSMAVLSILQKMRTVICSSPPHLQSAPCCIMLAATDAVSDETVRLIKRLTNSTSFFIPGAQAKNEADVSDLSKLPFFVSGTPGYVIDLIKKNKIDLKTVKYLLADECHKFNRPLQKDSRSYISKIKELLEMLLNARSSPVCCFLSDTYDVSNLQIKQLFTENELPISVIIKPTKHPIEIGVQIIAKKEADGHKKKIATLCALVEKFRSYLEAARANAENKKARRKFLILTNKPDQVVYLYFVLKAIFSDINVQFFNRESLDAFCENSIYTWEFNLNGSSFVLVTEYAVLHKIDPGFVDQVLCFDLPTLNRFDCMLDSVVDLSRRLSSSNRFVYILLNALEQQKYALPIMNLLRRENCEIPNLLKELCLHLLEPMHMSDSLAAIFT